MRRFALALAVAVLLGLLGMRSGGREPSAGEWRRRAVAWNDRLHRWLVGCGAMRCERCGPTRGFDVLKLLRGP